MKALREKGGGVRAISGVGLRDSNRDPKITAFKRRWFIDHRSIHEKLRNLVVGVLSARQDDP